MSGYPLQVGDLPPGIVAVRVIRESFTTNVPGQTVLLRAGDSSRVLSAVTNAQGRVQFDGLQVGEWVRVRAGVGAETLESQRFQVPAQGGVRMVLVAGVGAGLASSPDAWPSPEAVSSSVPIAPAEVPGAPAVGMMAPPSLATPAATASEGSWLWTLGFGTAALLFAAGVLLRGRRPVGPDRKAGDGRTAFVTSVPAASPSRGDVLFEELVQLEKDQRAGRIDTDAYSRRREGLIEQLVAVDAFFDRTALGPRL